MQRCSRFLFLSLLCACCLVVAFAQTIPTSTAETLTGKKVELPNGVKGHASVFIVGFSRKSKEQTSEWGKRLRPELAQDHAVQIYEIAHLEGAPRLFRGMIVSGIRKGVPPDQQDNFFTLFEAQDAWKQWVGFSEPDDAYVVLVDKTGQATWKTHGAVSQASVDELKKELARVEQQ